MRHDKIWVRFDSRIERIKRITFDGCYMVTRREHRLVDRCCGQTGMDGRVSGVPKRHSPCHPAVWRWQASFGGPPWRGAEGKLFLMEQKINPQGSRQSYVRIFCIACTLSWALIAKLKIFFDMFVLLKKMWWHRFFGCFDILISSFATLTVPSSPDPRASTRSKDTFQRRVTWQQRRECECDWILAYIHLQLYTCMATSIFLLKLTAA